MSVVPSPAKAPRIECGYNSFGHSRDRRICVDRGLTLLAKAWQLIYTTSTGLQIAKPCITGSPYSCAGNSFKLGGPMKLARRDRMNWETLSFVSTHPIASVLGLGLIAFAVLINLRRARNRTGSH
jgi:hypothetical protein